MAPAGLAASAAMDTMAPATIPAVIRCGFCQKRLLKWIPPSQGYVRRSEGFLAPVHGADLRTIAQPHPAYVASQPERAPEGRTQAGRVWIIAGSWPGWQGLLRRERAAPDQCPHAAPCRASLHVSREAPSA